MREKKHPQISLNKLGEYLTASPSRRKSILSDQKRPKVFQTYYYQEALDAIRNSISSPDTMEDSLLKKVSELSGSGNTDHETNKNQKNAEAIESFLDITDNLDFDNQKFSAAPSKFPKLNIANVQISLRPDIAIFPTDSSETENGLIKLYFSTGWSFPEESGKSIASVLYFHTLTNYRKMDVSHASTLLIDVFQRKVFSAKKHHKRILQNIEAACEEIAGRWPQL